MAPTPTANAASFTEDVAEVVGFTVVVEAALEDIMPEDIIADIVLVVKAVVSTNKVPDGVLVEAGAEMLEGRFATVDVATVSVAVAAPVADPLRSWRK
ncbi:hypothetical protein LTR91_019826 [Friedmanniomyces endolithicus]|uniref:Uncharacterized protein n=1 Tax=Friedmanniomyces endolithicus TaxID=329885 RepID=A0AAN6H9U4_9PEZI|nr:hypothetical protein LTR57_020551 [Friedmanniomyces endolithicus]KAK0961628.1 hypothetical protein LTR91_019826 [Friedmanniomyces endolithicus]KAK0968301.1 hypothetical protein LTS01_016787 [Friedmanniomyces endolithicus]KAK1042696.1 hypothetical protein LTS16_008678 [Friedmanniomyces endolithicus]